MRGLSNYPKNQAILHIYVVVMQLAREHIPILTTMLRATETLLLHINFNTGSSSALC